ncbi:uncharacterized protein RCO7_05491 [Rhynchosporium graminicola]|uniref:Uncharacterized protein n=1 Tax=Rhynchosporium graminicola TaxID=2792576 RepID=A0A1E1KY16_9HELO|nr:uncharacterized protein RCO7_05491 [Rhynchosporium commune]
MASASANRGSPSPAKNPFHSPARDSLRSSARNSIEPLARESLGSPARNSFGSPARKSFESPARSSFGSPARLSVRSSERNSFHRTPPRRDSTLDLDPSTIVVDTGGTSVKYTPQLRDPAYYFDSAGIQADTGGLDFEYTIQPADLVHYFDSSGIEKDIGRTSYDYTAYLEDTTYLGDPANHFDSSGFEEIFGGSFERPFPDGSGFANEETQWKKVHSEGKATAQRLSVCSSLDERAQSKERHSESKATAQLLSGSSSLDERAQSIEVHKKVTAYRLSRRPSLDERAPSLCIDFVTQKMAPTYRNANRRQNRQGVDHGEYEGIPIRHWRRDFVTVAPPPTPDSSTTQNDIWAVELPHGMPKDYHLLPQHSQDLLRAARSGKIYKRPAPADEEEADPETVVGDKPEKKDEDLKEKGFTAKSWKQVARHLEGPDVVYLAKRRKGLVTATSKPLPVPTVTKATVKRIDAAGNEYVQDVVVPLGQAVEGEVISQIQIPDPNAPVGLAAVQATPPRPRNKPKKKAKGPGRGRKKKPIAPTSVPQAPLAEGTVPVSTAEGTTGPDGIKIEAEPTSTSSLHEDTEMADGSAANSDDDDVDDGDDGDEGDDDEDSVDVQESPSKPSSFPPVPPFDQTDVSMGATELPHAPPRLMPDRSDGKSGSPLKYVVMPTSTLTSPSEAPAELSPTKPFSSIHSLASESTSTDPTKPKLERLQEEMQQEVSELAPETLPLPPPEPTIVETIAALDERIAEEEEEEMMMDIHDNANNANIGALIEYSNVSASSAPRSPAVEVEPAQLDLIPQFDNDLDTMPAPKSDIVPEPTQARVDSPKAETAPEELKTVPRSSPAAVGDLTPAAVPETAQEPPVEVSTQDPPPEDDDDFYPDLLGGLEKSLGARAETPAAVPISENITKAEVEETPNETPAGGEAIPHESDAVVDRDEKAQPDPKDPEEMML